MIRIGTLHVFLDRREIRSNGKLLRIGSRAFEILELLIRANGALVSKDEIMQRVWPHTVVEENNLQVHIASLRKALADDRNLIVTVPGRGYRLVIEQPDDDGAPVRPAMSRPSIAPGALFGRERMVDEVLAALQDARIVTLVGAGGIGKTRVAIEAAARADARFPEGTVFVSLATVACPRFVPDALAGAFGIAQPTGALTLEAVLAAVARRRMLLVLDNCEHLLDAAARIASALTDADDGLCVLATSRESLRIHGERVCPVLPLDVPDEGAAEHDAMRASAVQLFAARARAADPRFPLDARSLSLMASVCRRLDGLPLAIELAAARAAVLGIDVLAAHLDDHFRLLTGGFRTALPRHQTLQAMYDWSDRLLGDAERRLLRWLGVFRDGFSIEAVRAVVGPNGLAGADLLDTIAGLVSKSLLILETAHGAPRYRLLTTTRAYAQQQLDAHGDGAAAARAHAGYFLELFRQAAHGGGAQGGDQGGSTRLEAVRRELGNLRAALDWAFSANGDTALGVALAAVAVPCLFDLSLVDECRERARVALDAMRDADTTAEAADARVRLLAAYAAALAHTAGSTQAVHDAWSEVHALGFDATEAELPARDG
ncbi:MULTISPECIES: winged helix-turn-helix domain-containing protein [Burkholderia]|uniref:Transcriptional regulator n=1 Tax=Burkholderia contaminans TaxID=488447 RepID=A0A2S5DNT7_9BURK|nr:MULTISPECIES: winged helix-turn-helix domain-containing protein [Burkholderia]EKS9797653.1 helix-turn-helix transcriptional regulator [Burkholderia cepacia]EKS9805363.1 helix-turn-helix transcriptional regulator [Burkholderia cepacia]EKS9813271.1 helix-turn-helix transcriptional regulator [Burkholderia cepacia]EKS9818607.1 helix-turn-helix transcriptional regulator [Burkholderia cepacia]EKS9826346.1 helix-turn-helix transcriptional regulator [Burkholderia cepacia]